MKKTGVFYGSSTGTCEELANQIAEKLGVSSTDVHSVDKMTADKIKEYEVLVLGTSTWGDGELQDDWYSFLEDLKKRDLRGKQVALFGCGDSGCYPDPFCDAIALLYEGLQGCGCTFIGSFEPQGYAATSSLVCSEGRFLGLAIDESAPEKTDARVAAWCRQLVSERQ